MGFLRKLKELMDPINQMTPSQIVRSMPSVWVRVPICICAGYYGNKTTKGDIVDRDAMLFAIAGTDVQVYGRELETVRGSEPYILASQLYLQMKDGSEKEKLEDATLALLMGEMIKGGTNISPKLAIKSVDLGFAEISKPIIGKLIATGYPPTEDVINEATTEAINKAMSFT